MAESPAEILAWYRGMLAQALDEAQDAHARLLTGGPEYDAPAAVREARRQRDEARQREERIREELAEVRCDIGRAIAERNAAWDAKALARREQDDALAVLADVRLQVSAARDEVVDLRRLLSLAHQERDAALAEVARIRGAVAPPEG